MTSFCVRLRQKISQANRGLLRATAPEARCAPLRGIKISDLYRPLKKPVTLRLDAGVIAWFRKQKTPFLMANRVRVIQQGK
jgi:uncharacterized protein (DUF4415 family)